MCIGQAEYVPDKYTFGLEPYIEDLPSHDLSPAEAPRNIENGHKAKNDSNFKMDISYQQQQQSWFSYSSPPSYSLGQRTAKPCRKTWRSTWLRKLSSLRPWSLCLLCSPPDCPSDSQMDSPGTLHVYHVHVLINVLHTHSTHRQLFQRLSG